jgi:hypothetical protein
VLAFASTATMIKALIRPSCLMPSHPIMRGQSADSTEKREFTRNAPYRRVEKKALDLEVSNREGLAIR